MHYPAEFMAALLSSSIGDTDSVVKFINEARELGIEVLPPDVNESGYKFTVVGDKRIRFGLGAIRNVGRGAIESILAARGDEAVHRSLYDLCERVDLRLCNKRVFEALIASGALDGLGGHRAAVPGGARHGAAGGVARAAGARRSGRARCSATWARAYRRRRCERTRVLPNVAPLSESERLAKEKEILGFYISGHPLEPFRAGVRAVRHAHGGRSLGTWTRAAGHDRRAWSPR